MLILHATLGVALSIGLDVAQVTNVAGLVGGSAVGLVVRVDLGAHENLVPESGNGPGSGRPGTWFLDHSQ